MSSGDNRIIDERGNLHDYIPRIGDPPPPGSKRGGSKRQRWGGVRFLNKNSPNNRAVIIDTGDLGKIYPIDVQLRFAANAGAVGDNPVLPWTARFTELSGTVIVTVIRSYDPDSAPIQETFVIDGNQAHPPFVGQTLPFDIINARALTVIVELFGATLPGSPGIWAEANATIAEEIADVAKVVGAPLQRNKFYATSAVLQQFLIAQPSRSQFIIVNTSTNADLMIGFDALTSWVGPVGSIVLPAIVPYASYESPSGGFRGDVFGIWNIAGNGGALVTETVWR
jgi:hypothetical protein